MYLLLDKSQTHPGGSWWTDEEEKDEECQASEGSQVFDAVWCSVGNNGDDARQWQQHCNPETYTQAGL